jgi:ubiquinone/menaquinone biosynthesis C-methylase UbiE
VGRNEQVSETVEAHATSTDGPIPGPVVVPPGFYDAELRRHDAHLRAAADVGPDDHVLDIGCGAGQTTRRAARAAVRGSALGVDLSAPMLDHARRLAEAEGLRNVTFRRADAQAYAFPAGRFDLCVSRFGTMFFAEPDAAFANIARALRPGARLAMLVWQGRDRNEWATAIDWTLGRPQPATDGPSVGPNAFSLADPAATRRILTGAGFADVRHTDVHEPAFYGRDTDAAHHAVLGLSHAHDLLAGADARTVRRALHGLRATLDAHLTGTGVWFDSRAWLVTATRQPRP